MAPSKAVNDFLGALGGGLLASMMVPQLIKLYKTRRAHDISLLFLACYLVGATLTVAYLYYEDATVAFITLLVEIGLLLLVGVSKIYLDHWGPYSHQALAASSRSFSEKAEQGEEGGQHEAAEQQWGAGGAQAVGPGGIVNRLTGSGGSGRGSMEGQPASDAEQGVAHHTGAAVQLTGGVRQRGQHL